MPTGVHADLLASTGCLGLALHRQGQTQHQCLSRDQECWESGELSSSSPPSPFLSCHLAVSFYSDPIFPLKSP